MLASSEEKRAVVTTLLYVVRDTVGIDKSSRHPAEEAERTEYILEHVLLQ
jgi:hypothetical protein